MKRKLLNVVARFAKYRYIVIIASAAAILALSAVCFTNEKDLAITVKAATYPEESRCPVELENTDPNGAVKLTYFKFTNTRYVKVTVGGSYKIEVECEPENANEVLRWSSSEPDIVEVSEDGTVRGLATGESFITVNNFEGNIKRIALVEVMEMPMTIIDAPYISQVFGYPNGCESVSTVMALNYEGIDITVDDFIEKYLDMKPVPTVGADGEMWGYSPWNSFLGDPRDYTGLCCYAPAIRNALNKFVDRDKYEVLELRDRSLESLCRDYLLNDVPVVLWATMYMNSPFQPGWEWNVIDGKEGETFKWTSPMHCVLLIGFDAENYYFNDPTAGEKVAYRKADVEEAYAGMFSQAIVIRRK